MPCGSEEECRRCIILGGENCFGVTRVEAAMEFFEVKKKQAEKILDVIDRAKEGAAASGAK